MANRNLLYPIPQPPAMPVLGNMLSLGTTAPLQQMMKLAEEHGPIYWLNMMGTPMVVVSGHSLVEELCDESRFDKSTRGTLRRMRVVGGDGLFTADTKMPNWSKAHNILLPNFGHRAMQGYHPMMLDIAGQMMLKWQRMNPDDEIDVVHDMTALTLDTVGLCGFDYRFNSFYREGNHPFVDALIRTMETTMETRGLPLEDIVMRKKNAQLRADVEFMNSMVDGIIKDRRASGAGIDTKPDLLSYMIAGIDRKTGERLDDENIRYQCNTFLIAGHETTSGLLSFVIYFLLKHRDVLARAYEEVDRVLGRDLSAQPTYAQVTQLTYIGQILKEALRLWPTAAMFMLQPLKDTTIGGQFEIKRKYLVGLLVPMLHRDPSVWGPNAEQFDPDNFSPEAEEKRPVNAYKPFGNGQRACIGRQFALQEATLVIGMVLQRFELLDHRDYQLKVKETLTIKPDGLMIRVRPRPQPDARAASGRAGTVVANGAAGAAANSATMAAGGAAAVSDVPKHGTPLLVLFGSNLGSAEEFARNIADVGEASGFAVTLAALDDYAGRLPTKGIVSIVCASYNGGPPDNAIGFWRWLNELPAGDSLAGVRYTVFGCGNRDWASTYQIIPRAIDDKLAAAGAARVHPRGEGDARQDLDGHFQAWLDQVRAATAKALGMSAAMRPADDAGDAYSVEPAPAPPTSPLLGAVGAMSMTVLGSRELQQRDGPNASDRSTRHIDIALPPGVTYRAGDHLGVMPINGEALVGRVLARFGLARDAYVRLIANSSRKTSLPIGEAIAVRRLLAEFVELQQVATRKQIATMAKHTRCPHTKPQLLALAADGEAAVEHYRQTVATPRKSVLDLLDEHPACELPFNVYLEMLPLMTPRYYSISSSPLIDASRCSITVGVVEGPARSGRGVYQGVSSTHLSRQVADGVIHAFIKETTAGFRLPEDPSRPIIMIGPGTGLAPFRAFLQERAARRRDGQQVGPALLLFGCRHPEQDYLYADELKEFADQGVVTVQVAFSRLGSTKTYVQDLLKQHGDEVWPLIDRGAVVYVCGDGSRMEPDVREALIGLHNSRQGGDRAASEAWMADMVARQRYVLDVWSGN